MINKIRRLFLYVYIAVLVVLDQVIKVIIQNNIKNNSVVIIKNILSFTYCENKGVAFSFGNGNVPVFVVVNLLMICGLIIYFERNRKDFNGLSKMFFVMTTAGGVSNVIDRIFRGFVIDFIDINSFIDFAIFNVADILIVCGVIGLAGCFIYKSVKDK